MLTRGKLLLVEYRVEQEKWDGRFGFVGTVFGKSDLSESHSFPYLQKYFFYPIVGF